MSFIPHKNMVDDLHVQEYLVGCCLFSQKTKATSGSVLIHTRNKERECILTIKFFVLN